MAPHLVSDQVYVRQQRGVCELLIKNPWMKTTAGADADVLPADSAQIKVPSGEVSSFCWLDISQGVGMDRIPYNSDVFK